MKRCSEFIKKLKSLITGRRAAGMCLFCIGIISAVLTFYTGYIIYHICKVISILCIISAIYLIFARAGLLRTILETVKAVMLIITKKILMLFERLQQAVKKLSDNVKDLARTIKKVIRDIVNKIKEKFSFGTNGIYKGARMATDYVDVKEKIANKEKAVKKKRKKYKDMDNVEKVRYLYGKKVTGAVKSGIEIEESMTPNETGTMLVEYKYMKNESKELIEKYNFARYDEEAVITDSMVEKVKKL